MILLQDILKHLQNTKFSLENEKVLQMQIAACLCGIDVDFVREAFLDDEKKNIIDFYLPQWHCGIEVKIGGGHSKMDIYRQIKRYCDEPDKLFPLKRIVVFTNKSMALPTDINNIATQIISLGQAWL